MTATSSRSSSQDPQHDVAAAPLSASELSACHCCGLIQRVPRLRATERAVCVRCGAALRHTGRQQRSNQRTAAAALAALLLYFPAILLPILETEQLGHHHSASLLSGTWQLLMEGAWLVAAVVFLFSIVLPLAKITLLLELSLLGWLEQRHRATTYRWMEFIGKWGMLDVLLLALMVMLIKVGDLVTFHVGPAVWAFVMCVVMSMIASLSFDPHAIWDEHC